MPPKLPLKAKQIIKRLEALGFIQVRASGSHAILYNEQRQRRAVIPMHTGDLPKGTVKAILRESQISLEEFLGE